MVYSAKNCIVQQKNQTLWDSFGSSGQVHFAQRLTQGAGVPALLAAGGRSGIRVQLSSQQDRGLELAEHQ